MVTFNESNMDWNSSSLVRLSPVRTFHVQQLLHRSFLQEHSGAISFSRLPINITLDCVSTSNYIFEEVFTKSLQILDTNTTMHPRVWINLNNLLYRSHHHDTQISGNYSFLIDDYFADLDSRRHPCSCLKLAILFSRIY